MTQLNLDGILRDVAQEVRNKTERKLLMQRLLKEYPGNSSRAQCRRMLAALQILGSATTLELARDLDVLDPPARKFYLVSEGHNISLAWDHDETESGVTHRVGRYFLARDVAMEVAQ